MTDDDSGINCETSESGSAPDVVAMTHDRKPSMAANGKITCGDLVVHPTKPWPWIGTVQPKVGDFARLCGNCGGLRVPSSVGKDENTQYKIRIQSEEGPVPLCESEHEDSPANVDVDEGRCMGDCANDAIDAWSNDGDDDHLRLYAKMGDAWVAGASASASAIGPATNNGRFGDIPPSLVALSVEGALPGRHFQVNWFPITEVTDMDGQEKVVVPYKRRSLFQDGSSVSRESALSDQGLVKQVHRKVDAFVLPHYAWVIRDLPASKLRPLMELEQCPGCFVIYKGWVGTVYNVWYRATFRMDDGTEFTLTDDQGEIYSHMMEEYRKTPFVDVYQMYPGLKVKMRWMLLENAKWLNGFQPPSHFKAKIRASRQRWFGYSGEGSSLPYRASRWGDFGRHVPRVGESFEPERVETDKDDVGASKRLKSNVVPEEDDPDYSAFMDTLISQTEQKMDVYLPSAARRELAAMATAELRTSLNAADSVAMEEEMLPLTVVKLEPIKVDVDWLSQVVADAPTGPKGNVIEGEELKNIYVFRSSRIFEPSDLGVRHRYLVEPGDEFIPAEAWRRSLVDGDSSSPAGDAHLSTLPARPSPGEFIYIAVGKSSSKIDILWENGEFETGADPEVLVPQYTNHADRDYFPAMYVTFQSDSSMKNRTKERSLGGKSDSGVDDTSQATKVSGDPVLDHGVASSGLTNWLPAKFGVVKSAKNSEKYATVAWYEFKRGPDNNAKDQEPRFLNEEDVSFYDLKFYYEFNYVCGTLVCRVSPSSLPSGVPNVGYVLRKNPDASVQVVWHDGKEETTQPWKLRQLTSRYNSEYSPSDVDDEQHYYSPTEHECEDLEDFRYYEYSALSTEARQKRIGLIVAVVREVILRLCSLTLTLDNHFPYADRKKLVKLTLSCNDVCNGFANLADFRDTVKEMFEHEQQQQQPQQASASSSEDAVEIGNGPKGKLFKAFSRFVREERLVWQCANWLYDWTEAMTTLQEDMRKYRNKMLRKEQSTTQATATTSMDVAATPIALEADQPQNDASLLAYVSDLQSAIEGGLSTITGILSVPAATDVDGRVVADYLHGLGENSDIGSSQTPQSAPISSSALATSTHFASYQSSHKFLRILLENSAKVSRLPCFSYTHHSELELSALYKQWPESQFSTSVDQSGNSLVMGERVTGETPKFGQNVVEIIGNMVEDVLHGRQDISYSDDNVLKICNETADALCLSVLSVMVRIIESIYVKLRPQIDRWLTESSAVEPVDKEMEKPGADVVSSDDEMDHDGLGCPDRSVDAGSTANDAMENGDKDSGLSNGLSVTTDNVDAKGFFPGVGSPCVFELLPSAPSSHRFMLKQFDPTLVPKSFLSAVRREVKLLNSSLPPGIFVKTYEDRMDLVSCMIIGPQETPYADGMFFFDVRLKDDYPSKPPHLFYKSMSKLLNPNLYEDGMVCLSLLGTWDGKETELWTSKSTLLQVFISIQSLILVPEPYFNEPGFEKEKGSPSGATKSRDYNEAAVLRTLESIQRVLADPPEPFRNEIRQHVVESSARLMKLLEKYQDPQGDNADLSFPLFPVTQGFCLCIKRHADNLRRLAQKWAFDDM